MGNRTNLLCDSFSSGSSFRGTPERKQRTFKSSLVPVRAVRARGPQRSKVDKETKKARPPKLTVKGKLPYVPTGACPKERGWSRAAASETDETDAITDCDGFA